MATDDAELDLMMDHATRAMHTRKRGYIGAAFGRGSGVDGRLGWLKLEWNHFSTLRRPLSVATGEKEVGAEQKLNKPDRLAHCTV
jgi:hypothetical protein